MKRALFVCMVVAGFASNVAMADAGLAASKGCTACHAPAAKLVGPSFKDIAAKYAGQGDAEGKLAHKVQQGSSGAWGSVAMPANPQVSAAEASTLVKWILSQK